MEALVEIFNYHRYWVMPLALLVVIYGLLSVLKDMAIETKQIFED